MGTVKPRDNQLDALDLIIEQHDKVDQLIAQLEDEEISDERKALVFRALADNLAAHATIEEELFYPAVLAKQTEDKLLEATEEHLAIKRVLADLLNTELDDPRFDAKLQVLKEEVQHHAREEEEGELFPKLRGAMTREELAALGGEMLSMFERLMQQDPRLQVPRQTREPAELH
ncbi:MAG TPA: hemerythrin domain-containing protein [Kofleriaceae bacterium]|nr:hemerythrin domain-containing protein [Kofleriaceae bacterium]